MNNITGIIRKAGIILAGIVLGLFVSLSLKGTMVEAAMEQNVFTEPFCAPYYAPVDAGVKTSATTYGKGWQKNGSKWFYMLSEREYYAGGWKQIQNEWYYFDDSGYCVTGWIRVTEEIAWGSAAKLLYFDKNSCAMAEGYRKIDEVGRYFNESGYLVAGRRNTVTIDGLTYIIDDAGICSRVTPVSGEEMVNAQNNFESLAPDDVVSGNYEFQAKVNEHTVVEPFGFDEIQGVSETYSYLYWCSLPDDSYKGRIGAWYRNVGTFKGRTVDVRFVISDYRLLTLYGSERGMVGFNKYAIGIAQTGVEYAECRIEFYDHESGEQINVRGYATVADVDFAQACAITSPYDKIYIADNCELLYGKTDDGFPVFADDVYKPQVRTDEDTSGQVLVYYDCDYFSFRFYGDAAFWKNDLGLTCYTGACNGWQPHFTENDEISDPSLGAHSWQGYVVSRFARVETPYPPVKTVTDSDETDVSENTLYSLEEQYTYKISQNVPYQSQQRFYYERFAVSDTLEPCLEFVDAKVIDDTERDLSSLFLIRCVENTVTFEAMNPDDSVFYGKNYHFLITVKPAVSADFSSHLENGQYVIPNTAELKVESAYENETYQTDVVNTKVVTTVRNCSFEISKTSEKDGSSLRGAVFALLEWNGTDYEESALFNDLGDGTYVLENAMCTVRNQGKFKVEEKKAPEGFLGGWSEEFQVKNTDGDDFHIEWDVKNTPENPKAYVLIDKINKVTGKPLSGARFEVFEWNEKMKRYDQESLMVLEEISGSPGKYKNKQLLERTEKNQGRFRIKETVNPSGYIGKWEKEIYIEDDNGGIQEFSYTCENTELMELKINKTICTEDLYEEHGDAVFVFRVNGTDVDGILRSYACSIEIPYERISSAGEDGKISESVTLKGIPAGVYEISEMTISRYVLTNVAAVTDNFQIDMKTADQRYGTIQPVEAEVMADLTEMDGEVTYENRKAFWDRFSHNDLVINSFAKE